MRFQMIFQVFFHNTYIIQFFSPIRKFKNPEARADSSPDPSSARTNAKNKLVSVLRKSISPENSFRKTESELKPRHTARISLRAEPKKEKCPFHLRKNPPPRKSKEQETFFLFGVAE